MHLISRALVAASALCLQVQKKWKIPLSDVNTGGMGKIKLITHLNNNEVKKIRGGIMNFRVVTPRLDLIFSNTLFCYWRLQ